jgi:hypothetical protein
LQETAEKFRLEAQAAKQAAQQARLAEQQAKAAMLKVRQRAEEARAVGSIHIGRSIWGYFS